MEDRTPEAILARYSLRIRVQKAQRFKGRYALYQARESFGHDFKVRVTVKRHPDRTICLYGIRSPVPPGYRACCESFEYHLSSCIYDIRYEWWRRAKQWVICVADGGSSGIVMAFCPHCGTKLPGVTTDFRSGRIIEI